METVSVCCGPTRRIKYLFPFPGCMLIGSAPCDVCEEDCDIPNEFDYQCAWCLRSVHPACKPKIAEVRTPL